MTILGILASLDGEHLRNGDGANFEFQVVKPPTQPKHLVGFYLKLTLHHPATHQWELNVSNVSSVTDLSLGSWENLDQIPTVTITFVKATFAHIRKISAVSI